MADLKISELTNLTAADPANDMIPIVDVSATPPASGSTKRISINNILACSPSATLASATITGDLTVDTSTLKVDSANNRVGIGTATPGNLLSVRNEAASGISYLDVRGGVGGAGVIQISGNGTTLSTTSFDLGQNSGGAFIYQRDALPLSILVNGSERYAISSTGVATWSNVGGVAGTAMTLNSTGLGVGASPAYKIHSVVTSGFAGAFRSSTAVAGGILCGNSLADLIVGVDASGNGRLTADTSKYLGLGSGGINDRVILDSSGNVISNVTGTAPTLATNSQMVFNLTSNTNLRISVRGTDGTTRTANITLA